ncbi:SAM-dependent methyltransferase [Leptospira perolatii]|uniref:SAM-dependent methyltransferase n=1 Tax=Leptospira perolatii TaxID=2023191 RepID=A0A2M9ZJY4_9LEPT|nr:SAM-dependent methyltransferase [Leptospira perolatii]PJZ69232.1 SAM-dependent methyltransferase [Leptospira perolatii]PJZ72386.1 SAM-dependent methyltransferase [Leptospira perolatii]
MKAGTKSRFRRYQLNKSSESILQKGHPWILSGNLSSAASIFKEGDWLALVSGSNQVLGFGIFSNSGPIGIRILQIGNEFSESKLRQTLEDALTRRKPLSEMTNAYRILHGENDGIPGITVDRYGKTWIVQVYSAGLEKLGRWCIRILQSLCSEVGEPKPVRILLLSPNRIGSGKTIRPRFLKGESELPIEEEIELRKIPFRVKLPGQKGGLFLDVRNLRSEFLNRPELVKDKQCAHLFCHTGFTSICMGEAGAKSILSADGSEDALLEFSNQFSSPTEGLENYGSKKDRFELKNSIQEFGNHSLVRADLFREWDFMENRKFGCIVLDPPNLAPNQKSVPGAKKAYKNLIQKCLQHLSPGGNLILLSCSGRLSESEFEKIGRQTLDSEGWSSNKITKLSPESDHPTKKEFPEGRYFKVHIYENCTQKTQQRS